MKTYNVVHVVICLALVVLLNACAPYVDSRREAGLSSRVGKSSKETIAICYSSIRANQSQLLHMAQHECEKNNQETTFDHVEKWNCNWMTPHRVFYKCVNRPTDEFEEAEKNNLNYIDAQKLNSDFEQSINFESKSNQNIVEKELEPAVKE